MTTTEDEFRDGRWLQRVTISGKYTWTVSGVLWNNVKERCTEGSATQRREPSYIGSVNGFESFDQFVNWNRKQIGYNRGYDLDSDILKKNSKVYSEETCLLVPSALNRFLQSRKKLKNYDLPQGVSIVKGHLCVKSLIKDDVSGENIVLLNKTLKLHEVETARELYKNALHTSRDIWLDRLENSGRYEVDPRVIDYLKSWQYVCDWRHNG